jgi:ABC-type nitrate/sulfonate/bicarbonate transport system substrate-binding protein
VPLAGALAGYDVKIVGVALPGPLFQFVSRPEISSVQGLRDKRLGTNSVGSTDHQIVSAVLRKYGLEEVVTVLGLGDTPLVAESLKSGGIDAASMSPPWPAKLRREGYPILLNVSAELEIPQAGLATSVQRLEQQRAQVERVLRAEMEAIRYLQAHRAETIQIIAQAFDMDDATAEEAYDSAVGSFDARLRPSEAGIFNLATEVLASAGQTRTMAAAELYARVVDARPVEAVLGEPVPR